MDSEPINITTPLIKSSDDKEQSNNEASPVARQSWHQRVGWFIMLSIPVGSIVILVGLSFLGFLWFAPVTNTLWLQIITDGWLTRTITIVSTLLRNAVAIHVGGCTSMLASVAIERGVFGLSKVAAVSALRYRTSRML